MKNPRLLVIFLTVFIDLLGFGIVIPILPVYTKELGASNFEVGLIAAVFSIANFFFTPFLGSYSDRVGRKPIILLGVLCNGLGYLFFGWAKTLQLLIFSRFLCGIGSSNISAATAYVADITKPEERAKSMGMIGAAFGLGFTIGPVFGGLLKSAYGIEYVGYAAAALCLFNLILAYFILPESLAEKNAGAQIKFIPVRGMIELVGRPVLKELSLMSVLYIFAFSMFQITIVLLWHDRYAIDDKHVGYGFAVIGILTIIVQAGLVGPLAKQFGEKKLLKYGSLSVLAGFLLIPFVDKTYVYILEIIPLALIALGNGALNPSINSMVSKNTDKHEQGRVLGLLQSFGALGRIVGPVAGGGAYGIYYGLPYLSAAAVMGVCFLLAVAVGRIVDDRGASKSSPPFFENEPLDAYLNPE